MNMMNAFGFWSAADSTAEGLHGRNAWGLLTAREIFSFRKNMRSSIIQCRFNVKPTSDIKPTISRHWVDVLLWLG